jgi:AICAR transformylase/IMP cyclohydrolase PurH
MKKKKNEPIINPAFKEEAEKILEQIKQNIHNLEYSDLKQLKRFTTLKEFHYYE